MGVAFTWITHTQLPVTWLQPHGEHPTPPSITVFIIVITIVITIITIIIIIIIILPNCHIHHHLLTVCNLLERPSVVLHHYSIEKYNLGCLDWAKDDVDNNYQKRIKLVPSNLCHDKTLPPFSLTAPIATEIPLQRCNSGYGVNHFHPESWCIGVSHFQTIQ